MNSGIPFVKIADRVEAAVDLIADRVGGPPLVFKHSGKISSCIASLRSRAGLYEKSRLWLGRARALCNCGKERFFDAREPLHAKIVTSFSDVIWQATTSSSHSP